MFTAFQLYCGSLCASFIALLLTYVVDVFYQTRLQTERFKMSFELHQDYKQNAHRYKIDSSVLDLMKPEARILHPLPRLGEIAMEVDSDPRAAYFRQAQNGLYIRMALLLKVLNK